MPLKTAYANIVTLQVDAIVNAANGALQAGGGVCGAIFAAAGYAQMQASCDAIGGCATGEAVITSGFALPARYVIHTVGPVWQGGGHSEEKLLTACYQNALALAMQNGIKTIAFPLISAGIYGYPREEALAVARKAIEGFLAEHGDSLTVTLALYPPPS